MRVLTVWMWELAIKKAEHWRIDSFELWCWRRLLRVPWTARRSNQSILKEISPEYSLKALMLKLNSNTLATWCEELTHSKRPWCWERLKVGGAEDDRGWDGWMASLTQWTWVCASSESCWWREAWHSGILLLLSRFSRVRLCATPEMAAHQAPPSLGFSRQEHWSGLPFPSPMHESEKWKWSRSVVSDS